MNRVVSFLQKYFAVISVLIGISILLSVTFSSYVVTSNNHKAAEMYIGELKYSMEIDETTTNTLTVPAGETIIDVKVNNLNPVDTYYKLLYLKNTNITVKYYESTKDTDDVVTTYNKPNASITSSNSNTIKLLITNNSTSSQNIALTMKGGYITNTIQDIITPSTYSEITLVETPSTNTYFCKTNNTLTQGLQYVNGQYTYAYKQRGKYASSGIAWSNISNNGWGVQLTNKTSTEAVTSNICTYINNRPITSMSYMFRDSQAASIDLNSFDTSNITDMSDMFTNTQVTTLDLSNFDTSKVTNMSGMFDGSKATTLDLSSFNTSNVTNMSSMFFGSQATILDVSNFDTSKVIYMNHMFYNSQATIIDLSSFNTSNVTNMSSMFFGSQATILDVSNFDTSKVIYMNYMFYNSQATTLDISGFNTSNVTNMSYMFYNSQATTLDVSHFDTSKVTNMSNMFQGSQVTTLDLSSFDTSNVTNIGYMFRSATNLKTIYVSNKFNTGNVTNSSGMFTGSTNLVGGKGTKYNSSYVDKTYARIDSGTSNPGYFTDIADKPSEPNSFATDSWKTIINAVKNNNIGKYNVGDTKTIDMGTYGTHTLRIANTSTPSECSTSGFSQSACGFVLEFADIITTHNINPSGTYKGTQYDHGWSKDGWPASSMYTFVNTNIYNALPSDLKSGIINTRTISGYGTENNNNFTSIDKLYLLAPIEIYANSVINYDTASDLTRTLDYYLEKDVSIAYSSEAIKKNGTSAAEWWLRTAYNKLDGLFFAVDDKGQKMHDMVIYNYGVSPAFRIG